MKLLEDKSYFGSCVSGKTKLLEDKLYFLNVLILFLLHPAFFPVISAELDNEYLWKLHKQLQTFPWDLFLIKKWCMRYLHLW